MLGAEGAEPLSRCRAVCEPRVHAGDQKLAVRRGGRSERTKESALGEVTQGWYPSPRALRWVTTAHSLLVRTSHADLSREGDTSGSPEVGPTFRKIVNGNKIPFGALRPPRHAFLPSPMENHLLPPSTNSWGGRNTGLQAGKICVCPESQVSFCCSALGNLLNLSDLQCSHLDNGKKMLVLLLLAVVRLNKTPSKC